MGYANLGDYVNVKGGPVISDATYAKLPVLLRQFYRPKTPTAIKVQVTAPPSTNPILKAAQQIIANAAPKPSQVPVPVAQPSGTTQAIQNAAPIIAATAGGAGLGPIAAAIPAVIDAAAEPSPVRIRVDSGASPNLSPNAPITPVPSGNGSAEIYNADGSPVTQAAVTASTGTDVLSSIKSLPPVALAALAGGVLFLLSKRGR